MPEASTMKPEPSELVLRGCSSPFLSPPLSPPLEPPPGPRRFLKKSSKNSSNGEPGGSCGTTPLPSPPPLLASTVCEVEILTTASTTFSATSAMPSGPRASAGAAMSTLAAPTQIAVSSGRTRWLRTGIAPVISALFHDKSGRNLKSTVRPNRVTAQAFERTFVPISRPEYGETGPCLLTMAWIPLLAPDHPDQNKPRDRRSDPDRAQDV